MEPNNLQFIITHYCWDLLYIALETLPPPPTHTHTHKNLGFLEIKVLVQFNTQCFNPVHMERSTQSTGGISYTERGKDDRGGEGWWCGGEVGRK